MGSADRAFRIIARQRPRSEWSTAVVQQNGSIRVHFREDGARSQARRGDGGSKAQHSRAADSSWSREFKRNFIWRAKGLTKRIFARKLRSAFHAIIAWSRARSRLTGDSPSASAVVSTADGSAVPADQLPPPPSRVEGPAL